MLLLVIPDITEPAKKNQSKKDDKSNNNNRIVFLPGLMKGLSETEHSIRGK